MSTNVKETQREKQTHFNRGSQCILQPLCCGEQGRALDLEGLPQALAPLVGPAEGVGVRSPTLSGSQFFSCHM